jgi:hypothetical protein
MTLYFPSGSEVSEVERPHRRRVIRPRDRVHALGIVATRHSIFSASPIQIPSVIFPSGFQAWWQYGTGITTTDTTLGNENDFAHANWTKTNITITTGQADPVGGSSATRLAENSGGTLVHNLRHTFTNQASGALMRVQIRAKANGRSWLWIGDNSTDRIYFNVSTGAVGSTPGANVRDSSITSLGNGWWLCSYTVRATSNNLDIGIGNADNSLSYSGDGTSGLIVYLSDLYQRRVNQWNDASGNGVHLVQATDSRRPYLEPDGSGITFLAALFQSLERTSSGLSGNFDHSLFILAKSHAASIGNFQGWLCYGRSQVSSSSSLIGACNLNVPWFGGGGSVTGQSTNVIVQNTFYRRAKVHSGTTSQHWRNGSLDQTASATYTYTIAASPGFIIGARDGTGGGGNNADITVKDAVVANVAATSDQRLSMDQYHASLP